MTTYYFAKTVNLPFDAAIDPIASMQAVDNASLEPIAQSVRDTLQQVIDRL